MAEKHLHGVRDEPAKDQLLMTPEEAAEALRVGRTTVYALIKSGALRPVHIGRSCRVPVAELERYVGALMTCRAGQILPFDRTEAAPVTTDRAAIAPPSP